MKNLKYYLNKAYKEKWAIGQFNFSDFSQVKGIVKAAQNLKAPIILGTSEGEGKFVGLHQAVAIRNVLRKETLRRGSGQALPIFLNSDHGKSFEYLKEAILAGYDMVHFDGSKLSLEENIKISKKVVEFAKKKGIVVEGEVGRFGTDASRLYQEKFEIKEEDLTNPMEAVRYLDETNVDILAVSVGTFHGIDISGISPHIRLERLKALRHFVPQGKINDIGFVLHGGSGTPEEDIKKSISLGITKININTEIRLAFTSNLRKTLDINKKEITPYKYLQEAIDSVQAVVEGKIKLFSSDNKT